MNHLLVKRNVYPSVKLFHVVVANLAESFVYNFCDAKFRKKSKLA